MSSGYRLLSLLLLILVLLVAFDNDGTRQLVVKVRSYIREAFIVDVNRHHSHGPGEHQHEDHEDHSGEEPNFVLALSVTFLSGMATSLGGALVLFQAEPKSHLLGWMLAFAAGVMMYISFVDLLPHAIEAVGFYTANISMFVGMGIFAVIELCVPEVEVTSVAVNAVTQDKQEVAKLWLVGITTAVGISLHNFPEGVAVLLSMLRGSGLGWALAIAMAAHNIPEGMAVAYPVLAATGSRWKAFYWATLSGLCEPFAAIIFGYLLQDYLNEVVLAILLAAVSGIMIMVCIKELIPTALHYASPAPCAWSFTIGMMFIAASLGGLYASGGHEH
jgi:zinc transporter, ZIP family